MRGDHRGYNETPMKGTKMSMLQKKSFPTELDLEIARSHIALKKVTPGSAEYKTALGELSALYEIRNAEVRGQNRISKDTLASGIFATVNVLSVILFESVGNGILTSKSMSMLPKVKTH